MQQLPLIDAPTQPAPLPSAEYIPIEAANRLRAAQKAHSAARASEKRARTSGEGARNERAAATANARRRLDTAMDEYRQALRASYDSTAR